MVPSLLLAAALAQSAEQPVRARVELFDSRDPSHWNGATYVPVRYPVLVWGDPPHLRGYPWGGLHPTAFESRLTMSVKSQKPKVVSLAAVQPADPAAERINALEWGITALRASGGSQQAIDQLQRELDALKK